MVLNILLIISGLFLLTASVGIVRFNDFLSRLHPAGVADSAAITVASIALIYHYGFTIFSL